MFKLIFAVIASSFILSATAHGQDKQHINAMDQQVFYDFVMAINGHNAEKLSALMTDDHQFIDAQGNQVTGRDRMKAGWSAYFQWFPDYRIEVTQVLTRGDTVLAVGFAGGTFKGLKTENNANYWRLPAAWKAVLENGKVKLWQVYADTKIPFDIMSKNK